MPSNRFDGFLLRVAQGTGIRSQAELASALGLNRSSISRAKQRDVIPEKWIARLCERFALDPSWLRDGISGLDRFHRVPKVRAKLDAGGGSHLMDEDVQGHFAFRRDWLRQKGRPDSMVLMEVIGDSMEPVIREGDTVLIDQSQQEIYAGGIYAVGVADTIMVKRLERHPHKLVLWSANPNYSPVYLEGDEMDTVRILGKVVGMWRDFR